LRAFSEKDLDGGDKSVEPAHDDRVDQIDRNPL
jgi:hypothetical protein